MRKYKIIFLLMIFSLLCGCGSRQEKIYVKDIFVSSYDGMYSVNIKYYDFNSPDENYITRGYSGKSPLDAGIKALDDRYYNFRLCENFFIDENLLDEFDEIFRLVSAYKLSPNVNIAALRRDDEWDKASVNTESRNPLYTFSEQCENINGIMPVLNSNGQICGMAAVSAGKTVKLDKDMWQSAQVITGKLDSGWFTSENGQDRAYIEMINFEFIKSKSGLDIKMTGRIRESRGRHSDYSRKEQLKKRMEKSAAARLTEAYKELEEAGIYSFLPYCKIKEISGENICFSADFSM